MGPNAEPAVKHDAHSAMASRRDEASVKMLRMSESVDGISIAPNTPSSARAATRYSALGAKAAAAETTAKPPAPIISSRRLPIRSPRLPMVTSRAASTSEYTSTIHNWVVAGGRKSWAMLGSANASTVLSTATSSTGSMSTASAIHERRGVVGDVSVTSRWVDISCAPENYVLLRTVVPTTTVRGDALTSRPIRVDGALGEAGHDGVHDLDAGGAELRGLVAGVQERPEHQPRPDRRPRRALGGCPREHFDDDLVTGVEFGGQAPDRS